MTGPITFPIFPLSSVLLVPGALLPLHVFEPRYRAMVADALASDRLIAMAMPLPLRDGEDEAHPRVHRVVGLGRIVHHRPHPDGRSDIVLAGLARMRIVRELDATRPYRTVEAEDLPDVEPPDAASAAAAARALLDRLPGVASEDRAGLAGLPLGRMLDAVVVRLPVAVREQHRIHAIPHVAARIAAIERVLAREQGVRYPLEFGPGDPRLN